MTASPRGGPVERRCVVQNTAAHPWPMCSEFAPWLSVSSRTRRSGVGRRGGRERHGKHHEQPRACAGGLGQPRPARARPAHQRRRAREHDPLGHGHPGPGRAGPVVHGESVWHHHGHSPRGCAGAGREAPPHPACTGRGTDRHRRRLSGCQQDRRGHHARTRRLGHHRRRPHRGLGAEY